MIVRLGLLRRYITVRPVRDTPTEAQVGQVEGRAAALMRPNHQTSMTFPIALLKTDRCPISCAVVNDVASEDNGVSSYILPGKGPTRNLLMQN